MPLLLPTKIIPAQAIVSTLVASTLFISAANIQARPLATKAGWGAELALSMAYTQSQSQFNVDDDNQITNDLTNSGKETSKTLPIPLARIDYTLDSLKTQFFIGNSRENVGKGAFQVEFGGTHQFQDDSTLTLAYFPQLPFGGDTWKDPYLTGQVRQKTEETAQGGRVEFKNVAGTLLDVQYAFADNTIDKEESGNSLAFLTDLERSQLHRNAVLHRISFDYLVPLSANFMLKPGILYTRSNAKGDANSADEHALRLQMIYIRNQHFLTGSATYGKRKTDIVNPIFNQRESADKVSLFGLYTYSKPFNLENWSLMAIGFWGETDSNINFYNQNGLGFGIGASYKWR